MKILFTADIHIKLGQKNVPVEWQKKRYSMFIDQLNEIIDSKKIDTLILGGDTFDRVPTLEELEVYFNIISRITKPVIWIYSGNHEAIKKNTTFMTNLEKVSEALNPNVAIIDNYVTVGNIDIIPYNKLKEYHPADVDFHGNILFTHVRGAIPPHVQPEVPLELFSRWEVVFAGDLHSHSNTQVNIVYPGSPMTTSFHRNRVSTGVIVLDSATAKWEWVELNLPQLIRKTVSSAAEMIPTDFDHTIYEIEGDMAELSKIKPNELLDKKIVQRDSTSTLQLKDLTMTEELKLYLKDILKLEDQKIEEVVGVFNDIIKNADLE